MCFGKRGVVPSSNEPASRSSLTQNFAKTSSASQRISLLLKPKLSAIWPDGTGFGGFLYPLSCLALGVILGGGVGATLAPQLLHAEDSAGVYDFIRMNAEQQARRQRPAMLPRLRLPQLSSRRANVMHARLPPERREPRHVATGRPASTAEPARDAARFSSPLEAILHDITLRAGDTVMMRMGAVVFHGAKHPPYTAADFTDFRQSTLLTKNERRQIDDALGLTRSADAWRVFAGKVRASQASVGLAKAQGMRTFFPVTPTVTQAVR